ncbi:hypothetical protein CGZ93_14515 [Enemella dayhoffiae]|uniref:Uncharacterized protein n=1 Tax=Enemella dayhoffiae TaxID=2016507 RepID=A0A255GVG4_9ACTN|nr:hypothetical protein CGZ93_14515 [Enemella dayhoffiae]
MVFSLLVVTGTITNSRLLRRRTLDDAVHAVTTLRALTAQRATDGSLLVNSFLPSAVAGRRNRPSPTRVQTSTSAIRRACRPSS